MLHKTLTGWNDPTGQRHEPGEIEDYSWLPDLSDLLAASVVRVWFEDVAAPPLQGKPPAVTDDEQEDIEQSLGLQVPDGSQGQGPAGTFPTARKGRNK